MRHASMQVDITEPGAPRRVVDACVEQLGSVDILINSAGIAPLADVLEYGRSLWDATVAVNLTAAFEMSYEAAQRMVPQRSGKIINICSVFSFLGGRQAPAYAATKHGIAGLTKTYCDELAQHNIQVNGIAPGYYATELTAATRSDPVLNQRVLDHIPDRPLGRAARPDGGGRLPREPRLRLRQRARPLGGRRLPRPLGRDRERHARPVPDRHRRRHAEHEGRRRRRRRATSSPRAGEALRPMSRPQHGVVFHPDDDLWDSLAAASRQALAALRRRSERDRGRRPLHDPLLQGVPEGGRIARRAGDQLDGRPRLPALPARRPGPRVRDDLLGLSRPPPHRRVPRLGREQHPPAVADRRRRVGLERRRRAARAVPADAGACSSSSSCPAR